MEIKLRQVTDNIHGTIFLSELESELISTPFFYRLHDIYQSSTVYMTFPSNRTKRYEHSLGTMALASKMFFYSLTNADSNTKECFFKELKAYFKEIIEEIINNEQCEKIYFHSDQFVIKEFTKSDDSLDYDKILSHIFDSVKSGEFIEKALDFYQYCPMERFDISEENDAENIFLYKCFLQAIRIVALFHDVGHPPYSHIIEKVLIDIYNHIEGGELPSLVPKKVKEFKQCLGPFISTNQRTAFKCNRLFTDSSLLTAATHERIGLSFLSYAIDEVVPSIIKSIAYSNRERYSKISHTIYYITVVEFAFAILCENNTFFKSFHKIVDGVLDSDRLDYIVRDSQNSGVDWGKIPYERIINSARLFKKKDNNLGEELGENDQPFVIAYPEKICDDIEDLLLVRYKIFARINFHHRCMKTSMALQEAVRELSFDYLTHEDDKKCINPDINILWTSLNKKIGDKKTRVIQWNDSWLISALHKALVELHIRDDKSHLRENLEEILLNKKKYYTLLKRGRDNTRFAKMILNKANISEELINDLIVKELEKYHTNPNEDSEENKTILTSPSKAARDSIARLSKIFVDFDLESLCRLIPLDGASFKEKIDKKLTECDFLTNSIAIINEGRNKNGMPKHEDVLDNIYLYTGNETTVYDEFVTLKPQIDSVTKSIPWLYIYFIPKENSNGIIDLKNELLDSLSAAVAESIKIRFDELFNGKEQSII